MLHSTSIFQPRSSRHSPQQADADDAIVLADIAEVLPGLTLRGPDAGLSSPDGNFHLLRIGDVAGNGIIQCAETSPIKLEPEQAEKYRLAPRDVLLANRGARIIAGLFQCPFPTVAGNQFYIIRARTETILPEYLLWFLNLDSTRQALLGEARGSALQSIPVSAVRTLPVPVPPLSVQARIVAISDLQREEADVVTRILSRRSAFVAELLRRAATGTHQPFQ